MLTKKNVTAGAKWLDKNVPGWARKIKRRILNIATNHNCILGQLSHHLNGYADAHEYGASIGLDNDGLLTKYGFCYGFYGEKHSSEEITEMWKEEIRKRRS